MDYECPICMVALHEPKGLPCSHTFCQECLQSYIDRSTEETFFNCPVCRQKTEPVDSEKPKSEWAELFSSEEDHTNPQNPCLTDSNSLDNVNQEPQVPRKLIATVTLKGNLFAGINDMVMLNEQSFIITDACCKKVWKFSKSGDVLQDVSLDKEPFGLCLLQNNFVAVSQPSDKKIIILDCVTLTIKDTFSFEKSYYGLGSDDEKKIFALYRDGNMCVDIISRINTESSYEISHVIKLPFYFCGIYRLRVLPSGHILIMNSINLWKLCCVDQNGEVVFLYEGDKDNRLSSTSDFAVGIHFIYFADKTKNTIHRIKHQGNFVDIPLTVNENLYQPYKIYVNDEGELASVSKINNKCQIQLFSS